MWVVCQGGLGPGCQLEAAWVLGYNILVSLIDFAIFSLIVVLDKACTFNLWGPEFPPSLIALRWMCPSQTKITLFPFQSKNQKKNVTL
jgi:hypothetical protein